MLMPALHLVWKYSQKARGLSIWDGIFFVDPKGITHYKTRNRYLLLCDMIMGKNKNLTYIIH